MRIISLDPAATELVYACGLSQRLVGVDVTSAYPPEVNNVPKLGHVRNLKAEALFALQPDCILSAEGLLPDDIINTLRAAGVRVVQPKRKYTFEGTQAYLQTICDSIGRSAVVDSLIQSMRNTCDGVKPLLQKPSVLFIYSRGGGNLMVAGGGTPVEGFMQLAGVENAVQGFDDFKPLTPEALPAADPDVILMFSSSVEGLNASGGLDAIPGYTAVAARKKIVFISMDSRYISAFGPGLCEGISEFNTQLRKAGFQ
jgi:iron complex transport system substrate-binding protein